MDWKNIIPSTLLTTAMYGMEFTGDIFNFFVFLEIASIASVALIAFRSNLSGEPAEVVLNIWWLVL